MGTRGPDTVPDLSQQHRDNNTTLSRHGDGGVGAIVTVPVLHRKVLSSTNIRLMSRRLCRLIGRARRLTSLGGACTLPPFSGGPLVPVARIYVVSPQRYKPVAGGSVVTELGGSQISSLLETLPGIANVLRSPCGRCTDQRDQGRRPARRVQCLRRGGADPLRHPEEPAGGSRGRSGAGGRPGGVPEADGSSGRAGQKARGRTASKKPAASAPGRPSKAAAEAKAQAETQGSGQEALGAGHSGRSPATPVRF